MHYCVVLVLTTLLLQQLLLSSKLLTCGGHCREVQILRLWADGACLSVGSAHKCKRKDHNCEHLHSGSV
jgi:hypothetical protein